MAFAKRHLYPPLDQTICAFNCALGHPARLQILRQLQLKGPMCVQVIGEDHPLSKEALSDHLSILRKVQLVKWKEEYPFTFYSLHEKNFAKARKLIDSFLQFFPTLEP